MKLRNYTIVPSELYVRRAADDQVDQIIDDLGRPGYVLVARQMGKTNLLLDAKRRAASSDLFGYLDVSNVFPDLRSFLRNIIDVSLETLQEKGVFLDEVITGERNNIDALPHKEHERELRRILQAVTGRVIICLDEIDALTKTDYSDQVFSFIRSIYFSGRANFPEFARLTYILSGVAEPTDLIRNKAISPFNIGEKIYLDDFTHSEFEKFLSYAEIEFTQSVTSRIFFWTSGQPRMSWDIVSALQKEAAEPDSELVDLVVRTLYFSDVDVPPVDHIKSIVEGSKSIRDALIAIHYGKASSISDAIRTRLYLAGISRYDVQSKLVSFKNKILEAALSEDFIRAADQHQSSFEIGLKHVQNSAFDEAVGAFSEFMKGQPDDQRVPLAQYWSGVSYYRLGRYKEAIGCFPPFVEGLPIDVVIARMFYQGMAYFHLGEYTAAIPFLHQAIIGNCVAESPDTLFDAKVSLGYAYLHTKQPLTESSYIKAITLSQSVIDNSTHMDELLTEKSDVKRFMLRAEMNLADAARFAGKKEQAREYLNRAREHADTTAKLNILLVECDLAASREEATVLLGKAVQEVFGIRVFDKELGVGRRSTLDDVVNLLGKLQKHGKLEELARVIDHVADHLSGKIDIYEFVSELIVDLFNAGRHELARRVVDRSLKIQAARGESKQARNMLALAIIINESEADKYGEDYLQSFELEGVEASQSDLRFLTSVCIAAINRGNLKLASNARDVAAKAPIEESSSVESTRSMISAQLIKDYLDILVNLKTTPGLAVATQGAEYLRRLSSFKGFSLTYFPENYHRIIQIDLLARLRGNVKISQFKREKKKYGRNDVIRVDYDGVIKRGKFKVFAGDISTGLCKIIE